MIQKFRLTHFDQLMKTSGSKLETNKEFLQQFGRVVTPTMKKSDLPITSLYSNRTEKESNQLNEIRQRFRTEVAKTLLNHSSQSLIQADEIDHHDQLPKIELSHDTTIDQPSSENNDQIFPGPTLMKNQLLQQTGDVQLDDGDITEKEESSRLIPDQTEELKWNIISETQVQSTEPSQQLSNGIISIPDKQSISTVSIPHENDFIVIDNSQPSITTVMKPSIT